MSRRVEELTSTKRRTRGRNNNEHNETINTRKRRRNDDSSTLRSSKKHQNDPRSTQKRPQNEPKREQKAIPNDKTTREPNQDDFKTVLDRLHGPDHKFARAPGEPFGTPKRHQNRSQNDQKSKRKIKSQKNRSKTILDPSWGDLGSSWVPSWDPGNALALRLPMFRENSLFRC